MNQTQACNLALARLGVARIDSFDEETPAGDACRLVYSQALRALMEEFPWNDAQTRKELAQWPGENLTRFEYAYTLPEDFIRLESFIDIPSDPLVDEDLGNWHYEYRRNQWDHLLEGRVLYVDDDTLMIKYTRELPVEEMSPNLADAFSASLAARLSPILAPDMNKDVILEQRYQQALQRAREAEGAKRAQRPYERRWEMIE